MRKNKTKRYCCDKAVSDTIASLIDSGLTENQARSHMNWWFEFSSFCKETETHWFKGRCWMPKFISKELVTLTPLDKTKKDAQG